MEIITGKKIMMMFVLMAVFVVTFSHAQQISRSSCSAIFMSQVEYKQVSVRLGGRASCYLATKIQFYTPIACGMSREELIACRPSATQPVPTPPSPTCCIGLSHANSDCLCAFRNLTVILFRLRIDPELALQLPEKCGFPPAHCD